MKTLLKYMLLFFVLPGCSSGQFDLKNLGKTLGNKPLTNQEVIAGLKEALNIGSSKASTSASKVDGFFKNPIIKIPFPPKAQKMQSKLNSIGMKKQVDEFILTMNRAAEEAAKEAAPIFADAVRGMTITDGMSILRGADTAATSYLRQKTSAQLQAKFSPVIKRAINKVNVTKYWNPLATAYNKIPFTDDVNPNLDQYITERALHGLFFLLSQEEIKIRKDPAARVTELLKKVFGSK